MEKLGIHIVELLNENPEVYLPGIGLFKKERIPAAFDENKNSFTAPSQRIILLSHEKGTAKLLIESISQAEEITDEESEEQLKKVIGAILLEVNEKGKVDIPGLGKLVKEQESLTLIQDKTKKEALPFYKSVKEFNLISPSKKPEVPVEKAPEPALENTFIDEEADESVSTVQEFEPERSSFNWVWPVLILLVVLGTGTYWYITTPQQVDVLAPKDTPHEAILLDTLKADTLQVDSLPNTPVDSLDNRPADATVQAPQESVETSTQPGKTTFEIIVVSFGKKADAQEYVETMKARGQQFHVLENRRAGNQIKVSAGSYATEAEAQISLNKIRESFAKEAWIYKKIH